VNQPSVRAAAAIRFENVDKRYGSVYALRRVSLEIALGECVVLAGRNGSGKTTLLRIAARLVRPTSGLVQIGANGAGNLTTGFVAHSLMLYDELSAEENLVLFARLLGVKEPAARAVTLLEEVGLAERRGSLLRTFSRGMRQRVAIARALLQEPKLLLLDEPATGLDPLSTAWLASKVRQVRDTGCTVLMSLHGESEISALATRAVRLEAGSVVADTREGASASAVLAFADA
jgi:heme exporter protein A